MHSLHVHHRVLSRLDESAGRSDFWAWFKLRLFGGHTDPSRRAGAYSRAELLLEYRL